MLYDAVFAGLYQLSGFLRAVWVFSINIFARGGVFLAK